MQGDVAADHRSRYRAGVVVLALFAFAASLITYRALFPLYSGDRDEGVYVFQANLILDGDVALSKDAYSDFFRPWLSGEDNERIFTEYQLGLPAFLALSQLVLGSMRLGLALVAAAEVVAVYGFAFELFRDRRVALLAGALLALSPIFIVHSALILTYTLALLAMTVAGWALLRAERTDSRATYVVAGLALGAVALVRPLDAFLFGLPVLWLVRARRRTRARDGATSTRVLLSCVLAGVAPFIAATLWYNWRATGSALSFPNMAGDPLNTFGFGDRRLVVTEPTVRYDLGDAIGALGANLQAVPSWLFGGAVTMCLAFVGACAAKRAERTALLALAAIFPVAYISWWATKLAASGALNGLGPHYYIPSFVPLVVLGALGCVRALEHSHKSVAVVCAIALVVPTAWAVPDKVATQQFVNSVFEPVHDLVPDNLDNALVFMRTDGPQYLLAAWPFFQTDPALKGAVVYALDLGAKDARLMHRLPGRQAYRLRRELRPTDDLFHPSGGLTPITSVEGPQLHVSVTPSALPPHRYVRAFITDGRTLENITLADGQGPPSTGTSWLVSLDRASRAPNVYPVYRFATHLTVGIETSDTADYQGSEKWETRMDFWAEPHLLTVITPGLGWRFARYPYASGPVWLQADISAAINVDVTAAQA